MWDECHPRYRAMILDSVYTLASPGEIKQNQKKKNARALDAPAMIHLLYVMGLGQVMGLWKKLQWAAGVEKH